jgi:hypothetical protein
MPLTDAAIRNAHSVAGKTIKLSDGGGLQLWLTETGSKLWYQAYRFAGKQRKLAIGPYARIGLKEARQRRDDAKRQIEAGVDPSLQKRLDRLAAASECRFPPIFAPPAKTGGIGRERKGGFRAMESKGGRFGGTHQMA